MKKILFIVVFLSFILGCYNEMSWEPPKALFDPMTSRASLAGFRMQMSARIAGQVAEERGYKIDTKYSDVTFDDIAEAGAVETTVGPTIYLKRSDEAVVLDLSWEHVVLDFSYGKIEGIGHKHIYYPRQKAEELLESYLERYPKLAKAQERKDFCSYVYKPNKLASIYASISMVSEKNCNVSIRVHDRNYSQSRWNHEFYERIEAIRRRY